MKIRFGKFGVKMFYRRMTQGQVFPRLDWPPQENYQKRLDVDALADGDSTHPLDIYYAPEEIRNHKVVIDIHGGGYIANTRKCNFGFASVFLDHGFDVVLLDYPLNNGVQDIIEQVRVLAAQLEEFCLIHGECIDCLRRIFKLCKRRKDKPVLFHLYEHPSLIKTEHRRIIFRRSVLSKFIMKFMRRNILNHNTV